MAVVVVSGTVGAVVGGLVVAGCVYRSLRKVRW